MYSIIITTLTRFLYHKIIPNLTHILFIGLLVFIAGSLIYTGSDKIRGLLGMDTISSLKDTIKTQKSNAVVLDSVNVGMKKNLDINTAVSKDTINAIVKLNDTKLNDKQKLIEELAIKDKLIKALIDKTKLLEDNSTNVNAAIVAPITTLKPITKISTTKKNIITPTVKISHSKNMQSKVSGVSNVQITAIWGKYCQVSNNCAGVTA